MHLTYQNKHTIKQFQLLPFSVKHVLKNWERNSFDELNLFQFECHPTPINRRHLERRRGRRRKRKKKSFKGFQRQNPKSPKSKVTHEKIQRKSRISKGEETTLSIRSYQKLAEIHPHA